ncbi:uncharacterized protein LOC131947048 [Physella acuta]|uniref:uncharacterized protein LOC131947048 n=1 Tax=Physella acuta TaxID=109671 RepID=UPI0027DE138F|nr:uncharacterized protein LOC131947048 [Physella acuta]
MSDKTELAATPRQILLDNRLRQAKLDQNHYQQHWMSGERYENHWLKNQHEVNACTVQANDGTNSPDQSDVFVDAELPWLDYMEEPRDSLLDILLSRSRRDTGNSTSGDKSIWQKIEEFYSDKNNMAMYCVLPVLILIYGGCSAIYCIHKCRVYLRRRKHKRLKEEDCDSLNSDKTDQSKEEDEVPTRPISQISQAWVDMNNDSKGKWSGQTEGAPNGISSPLPWLVQDKAAAASALGQKTNGGACYLPDKLKDEDILLEEGRRTQSSGNSHSRRPGSKGSFLEDKLSEEHKRYSDFLIYATAQLL